MDDGLLALPDLPVLTIRQPWAWLILHAGKNIENRPWSTRYRGEFLIHVAKGCTREEYASAAMFARAVRRSQNAPPLWMPPLKQLDRMGIVGIACLVGCVDSSVSPWFVGPYGFQLANVRPLPFTPCPGKLGFWRLPDG